MLKIKPVFTVEDGKIFILHKVRGTKNAINDLVIFPRYSIDGLGWEVDGSFMAHDYEISKNGQSVVSISKEWMTWGDSYELNISNPQDEIVALAVVLTIDCVMDAQSSAAASANN